MSDKLTTNHCPICEHNARELERGGKVLVDKKEHARGVEAITLVKAYYRARMVEHNEVAGEQCRACEGFDKVGRIIEKVGERWEGENDDA